MKKITVSIIAIFILVFNANSQIEKGNWLVGGNGSFSSIKEYVSQNNTSGLKYVLISTNIGHFLANQFAVGLRVKYSYQKSSYTGADANSYSEFGGGPFARYYFLKPEKQINIFSEINYQYTIANTSNTTDKANRSSFAFLAGPVIFFNNNIGLEFTIGYSTTKNHPSNSKTNALQFGIGLQIHLEKN